MHKYGHNSVAKPQRYNYLSPSIEAERDYNIRKLNDVHCSYNDVCRCVKNMDSNSFGDFLILNKEYLDYSEMNAYCYSFRAELDEAIERYGNSFVFPRLAKFMDKEKTYQKLSSLSDKFAKFYSLYNVVNAALHYFPLSEKRLFAENDIMIYWGAELADNGGTMFDCDFKINGENNEKSFDLMMKTIMDLIESECLEICENIYKEYE